MPAPWVIPAVLSAGSLVAGAIGSRNQQDPDEQFAAILDALFERAGPEAIARAYPMLYRTLATSPVFQATLADVDRAAATQRTATARALARSGADTSVAGGIAQGVADSAAGYNRTQARAALSAGVLDAIVKNFSHLLQAGSYAGQTIKRPTTLTAFDLAGPLASAAAYGFAQPRPEQRRRQPFIDPRSVPTEPPQL